MPPRSLHGKLAIVYLAIFTWAAPPGPWNAVAQEPEQPEQIATGAPFRGLILIDATGAPFRDTTRSARLVDELRRSPFTQVAPQVRAYGAAYYASKLTPKALGVQAEFDPLGVLIERLKGGAEPRAVYAWIDPFLVTNLKRSIPIGENHVSILHPDWLSLNSDLEPTDAAGNQYLEPGLAEVQVHLSQVVAELAGQYEIAGLIIGPMRYPGLEADWGYHPRMLDSWRQRTGRRDRPRSDDEAWKALRREALRSCLESMSRAAKRAHPGLAVGVFGLADGPAPASAADFVQTKVYRGALQDWPGWMESKLIDFVVLQNYRVETEEAREFDRWNRFAASLAPTVEAEVIGAVAGYQNISSDAFFQMGRVHTAGLMGVALATYREPVRDVTSRQIFFRSLRSSILSPDSERLSFPVTEVAEAAVPVPPFPPSATTTPPNLEIPPPPTLETAEGRMMEAVPSGETVVAQLTDELERQLKNRESATARSLTGLIEPSPDAVAFLKLRFPNIF